MNFLVIKKGLKVLCFFFVVLIAFNLQSEVSKCNARTIEAPKLKAIFVFNFLKYVYWSEDNIKENYVIKVFGDTDIYEYLEEIADNYKINDKKIKIIKVFQIEELNNCNILFIAKNKCDDYEIIFNSLKGKPILTVADCQEIRGKGVGFLFFNENRKIRFEADTRVFSNNGIQVSSQLLKLAKINNGE